MGGGEQTWPQLVQRATTSATRPRRSANERRDPHDETKWALLTTEFWAMLGLILAVLIAAAISDSINDVRAWTLVAVIGTGYILSRGIAKAGTESAERCGGAARTTQTIAGLSPRSGLRLHAHRLGGV